jgi:hypothetical protein
MTEARSREQVNVDVSKTTTRQQITVDEFQNFLVGRHNGGGKIAQRIQYLAPIAQIPDSDFANHERMRQDPARRQEQRHSCALTSQMLDPNRGIDKDHRERRRGTGRSWGSVPPSRANRRAASRSTNAFSASRTSADFSCSPVYSWALANNSSSIAIVVLIASNSATSNIASSDAPFHAHLSPVSEAMKRPDANRPMSPARSPAGRRGGTA